jgi:hypothetical protein
MPHESRIMNQDGVNLKKKWKMKRLKVNNEIVRSFFATFKEKKVENDQ